MSEVNVTPLDPEIISQDPRAYRGLQLAVGMVDRIRESGDAWIVPSQTEGRAYRVQPDEETCTCADFGTLGTRCKHIWAVEFIRHYEVEVDGTERVTEVTRVTYTQEWRSYNAGQTREQERFVPLLRELCNGIEQPEQGMGRPRLPLSDVVFALGLRTYSGLSGRRADSLIREAHARGLMDCAPSYNTAFRYLESLEMTDILKGLIEESAKPLAAVESTFAIDSTGIGTTTYRRWFDHKWGRERSLQTWVKLHAMTGVSTNIVTAVEATANESADTIQLPPLLARTAENFEVREVVADRAYSSKSNLRAIQAVGADGYIPFKKGATGGRTHHRHDGLWSKMFFFFSYHREEFAAHYHARSNAESTFSALKRKFGANVRSRTPIAQVNEALLKVLAYNVCVVIAAQFELGIETEFWREDSPRPISHRSASEVRPLPGF